MKRSPFKRKPPLTDAQKQMRDHVKQWKKDMREQRGDAPKKYGNKPIWYDNIYFPSQLQCRDYQEHRLREKAGLIKDYEYEVDVPLHVDGTLIGHYRADHKYYDLEEKCTVIADSKGKETPLFTWKWKHLKAEYPQFIFELRFKDRTIRTYPRDQTLELNQEVKP